MFNDTFYALYQGDMLLGKHRSGGLFLNPNQLAKAMSFLLVMALITTSLYNKTKLVKTKPVWLYMTFVVIILAVLISGSRTGMFVVISIFLLWNIKKLNIAQILLFVVFVIGLLLLLQIVFSNNRIFSFDATTFGSLFYKLNFAYIYIEQSSVLELLFGHGLVYNDAITKNIFVDGLNFSFDADIGFFIFHLGILGIILTLLLFAFLHTKYAIPPYVYGLFLWMLTSSIFFNIRSLVMMIMVFALLNLLLCKKKKAFYLSQYIIALDLQFLKNCQLTTVNCQSIITLVSRLKWKKDAK